MGYPEDIASFRTIENIPGLAYDEEDATTLFAEDVQAMRTEIIDTQDFIGTLAGLKTAGLFEALFDILYPIGRIVEFNTDFDPNEEWERGTWVLLGIGQFTVGQDTENPAFDTLNESGGGLSHAHTLSDNGYAKIDPRGGGDNDLLGRQINVASYATNVDVGSVTPVSSAQTTDQGIALGGSTDSADNLPPYIVTARWVRTA